jgi:hypothetical protein
MMESINGLAEIRTVNPASMGKMKMACGTAVAYLVNET